MASRIEKITNCAPARGRRTHYCTAGDHARRTRAVVVVYYRNKGDNPSVDPRRVHACAKHARDMVRWFGNAEPMLDAALAEGEVRR